MAADEMAAEAERMARKRRKREEATLARQVTSNVEVRVLPNTSKGAVHVADDVLRFKRKHFFGDRLRRVDPRRLAKKHGPVANFGRHKTHLYSSTKR